MNENLVVSVGSTWVKPAKLSSVALKRINETEFGSIQILPVEYPVTIFGEPAKEPGDKTTVWYPAIDSAGKHIWITEAGLAKILQIKIIAEETIPPTSSVDNSESMTNVLPNEENNVVGKPPWWWLSHPEFVVVAAVGIATLILIFARS